MYHDLSWVLHKCFGKNRCIYNIWFECVGRFQRMYKSVLYTKHKHSNWKKWEAQNIKWSQRDNKEWCWKNRSLYHDVIIQTFEGESSLWFGSSKFVLVLEIFHNLLYCLTWIHHKKEKGKKSEREKKREERKRGNSAMASSMIGRGHELTASSIALTSSC